MKNEGANQIFQGIRAQATVVIFIILIPTIIFGIPAAIYIWFDSLRSAYFENLKKGVDKETILQKLGDPDSIDTCGTWVILGWRQHRFQE